MAGQVHLSHALGEDFVHAESVFVTHEPQTQRRNLVDPTVSVMTTHAAIIMIKFVEVSSLHIYFNNLF